MAILSCVRNNKSLTGSIDQKRVIEFSDSYDVQVSDPYTNRFDIMGAPGINLGDTHVDHSGSRCINVSCQCTAEDGCSYVVQVDYGVITCEEAGQPPSVQPPDINLEFVEVEQPINTDVFGKPIVNTAGDPYLTQLTRKAYMPIYRVSRNEETVSFSAMMYYNGSCNADSFLGFPPGSCQLHVSANKVYDQNFGIYYRVNYEVCFNVDTFDLFLLSCGLREKISGHKQDCKDNWGQSVQTIVTLDKNGRDSEKTGNPPYVQKFQIYNRINFSSLNLV